MPPPKQHPAIPSIRNPFSLLKNIPPENFNYVRYLSCTLPPLPLLPPSLPRPCISSFKVAFPSTFQKCYKLNGRQENQETTSPITISNPNPIPHPPQPSQPAHPALAPPARPSKAGKRRWFKFVYKEYKFICKNTRMGTTESKIKSGYQVHSSSLFTSQQKEGVKPSKPLPSTKENATAADLDNTNSSEEEGPDSANPNPNLDKKPQLPPSRTIHNPQQYPYSSIGLVSCQMGEQKVVGTGCIIGGNFVLTCAHNVWSFREGKAGKAITFTPAYTPNNNGLALQAKKIFVPEELAISSNHYQDLILLDYAVIELQAADLEGEFGALGMDFSGKGIEEGVRVVGYSRKGKEMEMCELRGDAVTEGHMLQYDMNTGYGMSGAPILEGPPGEPRIVGLHVYCRQKGGNVERGGLRLDERALSSLGKWCAREEEELDLREKNVGREGLKYLSKHKWNKLVSLNLSRNGLENNTGKYLRRGHWQHLKNLDLGGNVIGKEGAQALAQSSLSHVATLNLWGNGIGKAGAYYLSLANWQSLTNLNLYNNDIGDEGVAFLTHAGWKRLQSLNLGKNGISLDGAQALFEGGWCDLASLNLWGNQLTGQQTLLKARLLQHFPLLKYLYL